MPWFKVDDRLPDNRKVRMAGTSAIGLWSLAGAWSSGELTDGFVPKCVAIRWDPRGTLATKLIKSGLWIRAEKEREPGYQFVNWDEYQPTKAEVEGERAAARDRMKKRRAAKRSGEQPANVQANKQRSSDDVRLPRPDPTRPDPTSSIGYEKGEGNVRSARTPPPPHCPKHIDSPTTEPCRACGDARRAREDFDREQPNRLALARSAQARRAADDRARAIDDCPLCDESGYQGAAVCDHDPNSLERNRAGIAKVREALRDRRAANA